MTCLSIFCNECEFCLSGRPALCLHEREVRCPDELLRLSQEGRSLFQMSEIASFAQQLLVDEHAVVKIDERMPLELAEVLGCWVMTGMGAVLNTAKVACGETVVGIGCVECVGSAHGCSMSGPALLDHGGPTGFASTSRDSSGSTCRADSISTASSVIDARWRRSTTRSGPPRGLRALERCSPSIDGGGR